MGLNAHFYLAISLLCVARINSGMSVESVRSQTRREYILSRLDGGIPATHGLLFAQTPLRMIHNK